MLKKDRKQRVFHFNLSLIILIVGFALTSFGFAFGIFLAYYALLLLPALLSGSVGILLLTSLGISYVLRRSSKSNIRIEGAKKGRKNRITIFDATRMGKGMPKWWRAWYGFLPFLIMIVVVASLFVVTSWLSFILFIGYSGIWSLVVLVAAKRWVDKNENGH